MGEISPPCLGPLKWPRPVRQLTPLNHKLFGAKNIAKSKRDIYLQKLMTPLQKLRVWAAGFDPNWPTVLLFSFIMVGMKKYEPGGNPDTIWYAAVSRNIAESNNFFHFYISKYYLNPIFDHMPLTYWVTASVFKVFGISDFAARLYPMLCSFFTYVVVYLLSRRIGGSALGLSAVLNLGLCFELTKWNGSLMHDVPLTLYLMASLYYFIKAKDSPINLYLSVLFFVLGIWTKGPIVFCLPLGVFLYSLIYRDFDFLKNRNFLPAVFFLFFLLSVLFWKPFLFENRNYYSIFIEKKRSYMFGNHQGMGGVFTFLIELAIKATIPMWLLGLSLWKCEQSREQKIILWVLIALVVPLSLASVKFPHYILPAYPLLAICSSTCLSNWYQKHLSSVSFYLKLVGVFALVVMVFFPIKITGKRSKETLNLVNALKLDPMATEKRFYFLGTWDTDMAIFQTFKFYGGIDLSPINKNEQTCPDFNADHLILPNKELPLPMCGRRLTLADCLLKNSQYCVISPRGSVQFELPDMKFPSEIY
jgi:4-amino-4-deoxy-L-arabinose transferase-like glycosyltransferase